MDMPFPHTRPLDFTSEEPGTEELFSAAKAFLAGFHWAKQTGKVWVGESIPRVLGLFLFELAPVSADVDRYIWVIVGDVPPAYISSEYAKTPREALESYISEMDAWAEAVERGEAVDELIPVNGDPTKENAAALKSRLSFIAKKIIPHLGEVFDKTESG
jgi:hypothetical protein